MIDLLLNRLLNLLEYAFKYSSINKRRLLHICSFQNNHKALRYVKAWVSNAPGKELQKYKYLS